MHSGDKRANLFVQSVSDGEKKVLQDWHLMEKNKKKRRKVVHALRLDEPTNAPSE